MEKVGVAVNALQLYLTLKFIHPLPQSRYIFSNTRDNFCFVTVWFNNNIQEFLLTMAPSIEGAPSCIVIHKVLKVGAILQYSLHKYRS